MAQPSTQLHAAANFSAAASLSAAVPAATTTLRGVSLDPFASTPSQLLNGGEGQYAAAGSRQSAVAAPTDSSSSLTATTQLPALKPVHPPFVEDVHAAAKENTSAFFSASPLPDPALLPPVLPVPATTATTAAGAEAYGIAAAAESAGTTTTGFLGVSTPDAATTAAVAAAYAPLPHAVTAAAGGRPGAVAETAAAYYPLRGSSASAAAEGKRRRVVRLLTPAPVSVSTGAAVTSATPAGGAGSRAVYLGGEFALQRQMSPASASTSSAAAAFERVEVTPLGAGSEVGRSCVILEQRGYSVMFDCGIHPAHTGIGALPIFDAIDLRSVHICLVTHFHLDHCGALPYLLTRTSFRGRVFMTPATKAIAKLLWLDYARMAAFSSSSGSAAAAAGGVGPVLFSEEDVETTLRRVETLEFHEQLVVGGVKISCFGAGHVLGACMFLVEIGGVRTLYTGDFSCERDRHVAPAEIPSLGLSPLPSAASANPAAAAAAGAAVSDVQLLLCESTYGAQVHAPRAQREQQLLSAVREVVLQRGGKVLLPVFALGRAQELLLLLEEHWEQQPLLQQRVPILFVSPLGSKAHAVFDAFLHLAGPALQQRAARGENPFAFRFVKTVKNLDAAAARVYVHREGPAVILAAPGMLQSGVSRKLFELLAPHKKNAVILTGYSVKGTLAHELKREPEQLLLLRSAGSAGGSSSSTTTTTTTGVSGKTSSTAAVGGGSSSSGSAAAAAGVHSGGEQLMLLRRRCSCEVISFSAHSDCLQTSEFIAKLRVPNVVLVHGERNEMRRLKDKLREQTPALAVYTPEILQTVSLQFCCHSDSSGNYSNSDSATAEKGNHHHQDGPASACAVAAGSLANDLMRNSYSSERERAENTSKEDEEDEDEVLLDVDGVVVMQEGEHPLLLNADDLTSTARIPVSRLQQKLRLPFPRPLGLLRKAVALIFEDVACLSAAFTPAPVALPTTGLHCNSKSSAVQEAFDSSCRDSSSNKSDNCSDSSSSHCSSKSIQESDRSHACSKSSSERINGKKGSGSACRSSNSLNDHNTSSSCCESSSSSTPLNSSVDECQNENDRSVKVEEDNTLLLRGERYGACDAGFTVAECVQVYRHPVHREEAVIEWLAGPTADLIADGVSFLLLDLLRKSSSTEQRLHEQLLCDRELQSEATIADVLHAQLSLAYGKVQVLPRQLQQQPHVTAATIEEQATTKKATGAATTEGNAASEAMQAGGPDALWDTCDRAVPPLTDIVTAQRHKHQQQAEMSVAEKVALEEGNVLLRFYARASAVTGAARASVGNSSSCSEGMVEESQHVVEAVKGEKLDQLFVPVEVDLAMRTVRCADEEVRQRVQAFVRRIESSLLPLPLLSS